MTTKIVTTRARKYRYKINISGGKYSVYVDKSMSMFSYNWYSIGETRSMNSALNIIRSHSGAEINDIT